MRIFWDSLVILTVLVWILKLAPGGYLSAERAAIFLVLLVFFTAAIRIRGSIGRLIRLIFRIGLPIASLASLCVTYTSGSEEAVRVFFGVLTVFIMLIGFYLMFRVAFSGKK